MRLVALVAATALGLALAAGAAEAKTFTDPQGRVIVDAPNNWAMQDASSPDHTITRLNIGIANYECDVVAFANPNLANVPVRQVFRTAQNDAQFTAQVWTNAANAITDVFPGNSANVTAVSVEHDHQPWPILRAEITSPNNTSLAGGKVVHAAMQLRPGLEIYTYCMTFGGAEPTAAFDALIHSVRNANDAQWSTQLTTENATHDAAQQAADQAAAQAAQHPQPQQQQPNAPRHNPHPSTSSTPPNGNMPAPM